MYQGFRKGHMTLRQSGLNLMYQGLQKGHISFLYFYISLSNHTMISQNRTSASRQWETTWDQTLAHPLGVAFATGLRDTVTYNTSHFLHFIDIIYCVQLYPLPKYHGWLGTSSLPFCPFYSPFSGEGISSNKLSTFALIT